MFFYQSECRYAACVLFFRKSRHKPIWGKKGGVLSMRMQVILDSLFACPGSAPIWGGKIGEFRDWTTSGFNSNA